MYGMEADGEALQKKSTNDMFLMSSHYSNKLSGP